MQLTKHHGLGNDFLVLLDTDAATPVDGPLARALCHRRLGIGADGLIRATAGVAGGDLRMELFNADGSRAEMSGNGIRCLAQAAVDAGVVPEGELVVLTDAGPKRLWVEPETGPGLRTVRVDMGPARAVAVPEGVDVVAGRRAVAVDMGNPHLVVEVADPAGEELARLAPAWNVEAVAAGPGPDAVTMRVWERGVGETQACGTGASAAAWAAHAWGLVGPVVTVHQPGGDAVVELKGDDGVYLTGPTQLVARVEVRRP